MKSDLQSRIDALSEEIRHYPGPIARCDLHLPALIEERAELIRRLEAGPCIPENVWNNEGGFHGA